MESAYRDLPVPVRTPLRKRGFLGALLGVGLLLRLAYSLHLPNQLLLPDAASFDGIAWNVASEGRYELNGLPTTYRPPSYVLFLASIYKIFGHDFRVVRVMQALLGLGLILLLMQTAQELGWGSNVQWAVGVFAAFYPFFIYYESHLIADAFLTFWHAAALWFFLRWIHKPSSLARAALLGFACSVLSLMKSIFLPLFVLMLAGEIYRAFRRRSGAFPWTAFVAAGLAFVLPLGLWALRNERTFGRWLLDGHGGRTTVETIVFHDQCKNGTFMEMWANAPVRKAAEALPNEAQQDAFYIAYTKQFVREHPLLYAKQSVARFVDLWRFYPRQDVRFSEGGRKLMIVSLLTEPFLILAGLFGLWKARFQWRALYPFYATLLFTTIAHTLITGQMRYRLPLMPVMILFSAYALFTSHYRSSDH